MGNVGNDTVNLFVEATKFVAKTTAVGLATTATLSTGGVAPLLGAMLYLGGTNIKTAGQIEENKFYENVGKIIEDVGFDSATNGLFGLGTKFCGQQAAKEIAKNSGIITKKTKLLINSGKAIKTVKQMHGFYGDVMETGAGYSSMYHGYHKSKGEYDDRCPACREDF